MSVMAQTGELFTSGSMSNKSSAIIFKDQQIIWIVLKIDKLLALKLIYIYMFLFREYWELNVLNLYVD